MNNMEGFGKLKKQLADVFMIDGRELIGLFECLAGGRPIIKSNKEDK